MHRALPFILFCALICPRFVCAAPVFANGVTNGMVNVPDLVEASGIVASRNNPGVLWTENDSGNAPAVNTLDYQGRNLGTYALPDNVDNEDIGMGPGPVTNVSYLYVMDIGDNNVDRDHIAIYQTPEPAVYFWQTNHPVSNRAMKGTRTITLTYPDGAHDAEAAFVDSMTGDFFVLTKDKTSNIYTAPKALLDTSGNIALTFVRTLDFKKPNGADISPLGNEILVRQENSAQLFARTNGQSISSAFDGPADDIPVVGEAGGEPNGEAIGFDYYGSGYFTLSDSEPTGVQPLYYFARTSFDGPTPPHVLVPLAANWKFLANGSDPGTSWQNPNFNDATWSSGPAQLGYGDGDEQTVVSYGAQANNKYITTYFRKTFVATNVNRIANLTLKLVVDDGANVYLNGALIKNLNLSASAAYNALASPMPTALRDTWQSYAIDPKWLREGTNTLAVEVHLASAAASSLSFDLQLVATEAPFITAISRQANTANIFLTGSSNSPTTIQATTNFSTWTSLGSVLLTNGSGNISDPQAANLKIRFYRAYRALP
ncbi:MAG TPA: hypothetical protein VGO57_08080 [Verrucomicrobiae bacterium]|jgi:hypothetical protein